MRNEIQSLLSFKQDQGVKMNQLGIVLSLLIYENIFIRFFLDIVGGSGSFYNGERLLQL